MALTLQDVRSIAHLARLELGSGEQEAMLAQLNDFFRIVEQMSAVDTAGVEPLYTPLSAVHEVRLRLRDAILRNAPAADRGLFLVPKVIE
jgi:aspartyl-tRNA(Asn)/glutamyl-tRNA(Gln) amidotransferase subunit C